MFLRFIAAALDEPLGAPSVVSIDDATSTGNSGNVAGFAFYRNGEIARYFHGVPIVTGEWLSPNVNTDEYEVRATVTSGDTPDGTIGSWVSLGTLQTFTLQESTPASTLSGQILVEIRWTGNNVVQDSATFTITSNG